MSDSNPQPLPVNDPEQLPRAAADGDVDAVKSLLAAGANVDGSNHYQQTPLIRAAFFGHGDVVRVLLAAGADPYARDKLGLTALDWSVARGFPEVSQMLRAFAPEMIITREIRPEPEPPTEPLPEEAANLLQPKPDSDTQPLHFTAAFTRAMQEAKLAESAAAVDEEPSDEDDGPADPAFQATLLGNPFVEKRPAEAAAPAVEPPIDTPAPEAPSQATTEPLEEAEYPTRPLNNTAALDQELEKKQLADTAQDVFVEPEEEAVVSATGEAYSPVELVNVDTELPDEIPTRPLSQFSLPPQEPDDAPTQSLSELFAAAELQDTLGKEKLGESFPGVSSTVSEHTAALPPQDGNKLSEPGAGPTSKLYEPADSYTVPKTTRLVGQFTPTTEPPPRRIGPIVLLVMVVLVILAGIPAGYLIMSRRWASSAPVDPDPPAVATNPAKTVEPAPVKALPLVEGEIKGTEISVPDAEYPEAAKSQGLSGSITVAIVVGRAGKVISARASDGPPLLRNAAVAAARKAVFNPQGVHRSGSITYHFGKVAGGLVPDVSIPTPGTKPATPGTVIYPLVSGEIKGSEVILPEPEYPAVARRRGLSGVITVLVTVNSDGKVTGARSANGPSLLRRAAESAARKSLFKAQPGPPRSGTITYEMGPLGQS